MHGQNHIKINMINASALVRRYVEKWGGVVTVKLNLNCYHRQKKPKHKHCKHFFWQPCSIVLTHRHTIHEAVCLLV